MTIKYINDLILMVWSGQTNDYKIGICCFSTKRAVIRNKSKDWLARNQVNVFDSNNMSTRGLLLQ